MNASYKIVLLGAFVLFAAVVGFYVLSGGEQTKQERQAEEGEAPLYALDDTLDEPQPAAEPAFEPDAEPRPGLEALRKAEDPAAAEETIGETSDQLPEAPVIGSPPSEEALAGPEAPDNTVRPAPEPSEAAGAEDTASPPAEAAEPTEDPRTAPTPETEKPVEEIDEPEAEPEAEPSPRPVPPAPATIPRTYTVKAGDTFASIAMAFYGEERAWFDIAQANPSIDPKRLQVGDRIVLPNRETVVREREEVQPPAPGNDQNYTVRPGDNLSKIAKRFYGDSEKWDLIYARNRKLIGPRPDALKVGMDLVIPQAYDGAE